MNNGKVNLTNKSSAKKSDINFLRYTPTRSSFQVAKKVSFHCLQERKFHLQYFLEVRTTGTQKFFVNSVGIVFFYSCII